MDKSADLFFLATTAPRERNSNLRLSFITRAFYEQMQISEVVSIGLAVALVISILLNFLLCCSICQGKKRRRRSERGRSQEDSPPKEKSEQETETGMTDSSIFHVPRSDSSSCQSTMPLRPAHCTCKGVNQGSNAQASLGDQLSDYKCHYVNDVLVRRAPIGEHCCNCSRGRGNLETESGYSEYSSVYY